jgi:excisionase family DNA binding protein
MTTTTDEQFTRLIDLPTLARWLGVTERHIRRLVAERRIPYLKWGHLLRFDPREIQAWLDANRRPARATGPRAPRPAGVLAARYSWSTASQARSGQPLEPPGTCCRRSCAVTGAGGSTVIERRTTRTGQVRYEVRLRAPDGRERSRSFATKREAKAYEAAELARRTRGDWFDPRKATIPFRVVADDWLATNPAKRPSTRARDEISLRAHLLPRFGATAVGRIDPASVQRWVNDHARRPCRPHGQAGLRRPAGRARPRRRARAHRPQPLPRHPPARCRTRREPRHHP